MAGIKKNTSVNNVNEVKEAKGLKTLGGKTRYQFAKPDVSILEAFPNSYPESNYVITFEHPEFTSLCPKTGQPDFGTIVIRYVPDKLCVESKSFKLYMASYRNEGSFMESLTNKISADLVSLLKPRRMTVEGFFNVRGGTAISVRVEYINNALPAEEKNMLQGLWMPANVFLKK